MIGVQPGLPLTLAHFGWATGAVTPTFTLAFGSVGYTTKTTYPYGPSEVATSTYKYNINLFVPMVGAKVNLGQSDPADGPVLKPYVAANVLYTIGTADISYTYAGPDTTFSVSDTAGARMLSEYLTGNWGGSVGFGGEYFFSEFFSVNGEVGLRGVFSSESQADPYYGGEYYYSVGLGLTYAALGACFYF